MGKIPWFCCELLGLMISSLLLLEGIHDDDEHVIYAERDYD
jgi:hypothetical protein